MERFINPETLRTLRKKKGWSQLRLAEEANVERRTIVKNEQSDPVRSRIYVVQQIAQALGVSEDVLTTPLPDSEINKDSQIFLDLDEAIRTRDRRSSMRIIEYLSCKLASALHQCHLELTDDWIEKLRTISAPIPQNIPRWQSYYTLSENDDAVFFQFLKECYKRFEGAPFSIDHILRLDKDSEVGAALRSLPVMESGKVNPYRLEAYLRMKNKVTAGDFRLLLISNLKGHLWCVSPSPVPG
ncbi:helix-turn-helix transcriptional regulator [Novosphingobium lindaniclasticum]|uniref:helix-turn-helix transcriptional regulator n=1 Tax=Novosphingobium lindaniclasticum TaxID=1329895 RepID=UPI0009DC022F|nr:helix-turn-helix domain-containing protein [Novosphingobium lindaniclasticum]